MAKVPTYVNQKVQDAMPGISAGPQASAADFGGAQAQQMSGLLSAAQGLNNTVFQNQIQEQKRLDEDNVRQHVNELRNNTRKFMADALQKRGSDAANLYKEATEFTDKMNKEASAKFSSPYQRDLFNQQFAGLRESMLSQAMGHQSRERQRYHEETLDAQNAELSEDAVANRGDATKVNANIQQIKANIAEKNKGMPPEYVRVQQAEAEQAYHARIIDAEMESKPARALAYLKENWDKLDPSWREKRKEDLEDLDKDDKALTIALNLLAAPGMTEAEALSVVDKKYGKDAELNKRIRNEVKTRFSERRRLKHEADEAFKQEQWDIALETMDATKISKKLRATDRRQIESYIRQRKKGVKQKTDWKEYTKLMELYASESDHAKFANIQPYQYRSKLADAEYKNLLNMYKAANEDRKKGSAKSSKFESPMKFFNNMYADVSSKKGLESLAKKLGVEPATLKYQVMAEFESLLSHEPEESRYKMDTMLRVWKENSTPIELDGSGWTSDYVVPKIVASTINNGRYEMRAVELPSDDTGNPMIPDDARPIVTPITLKGKNGKTVVFRNGYTRKETDPSTGVVSWYLYDAEGNHRATRRSVNQEIAAEIQREKEIAATPRHKKNVDALRDITTGLSGVEY